ncbi:MAG: cysteine--tRNA ligase [Deltaproteobacteria bacterium]|nr:cysteine--tRNA ligase [Deltaproteobacteria bacterium]MCB2186328.1 cysteine--tRNA ligase [Deltaproteobacteria bacterium]
MPLVLYNTQSRRKETFEPLEAGRVRMYVCGVTVYDDPHVGHARCYVAFDCVCRHFSSKGWAVTYIRNYTDIDDKIIRRAAESGEPWDQLAERNIRSFREDMASLGCLAPTAEPRATEHIPEMTAIIQRLLDQGHAYQVEGGDVLFAVETFPAYGRLSGRNLEDLQAGARIEVDSRKRNPMDFVLWKAAKPGEPSWESPFGAGRPGWHIECSAMSEKYLGQTFDLHGGGEDLVFPHHENEMAQSEAANGRPFARYWMHNGFVRINQEKMSKSLGNFFTIKDVLKEVKPEVLRFFLLGKHYRSPLDFSDQGLVEAAQALERLYNALLTAFQEIPEGASASITKAADQEILAEIDQAGEEFEAGMDDDFNTPRALAALFSLARNINRLTLEAPRPERDALILLAASRLKHLGGRLGLLGQDPQEFLQSSAAGAGQGPDPALIEELIAQRAEARKTKDWARADALRDQLTELGVVLEDGAGGTRWRLNN